MIFLLAWQAFFSISDAGLAMAILFFHHFFRLLASLDTGSTVLRSFANLWPKSTNSLHKTMNVSGNEFTEYVVFVQSVTQFMITTLLQPRPRYVSLFNSLTTHISQDVGLAIHR